MRTADYIDGQESRRAFEAIARATVANGGGTFHHKTGAEIDLHAKHAGGFVVSIEEYGSDIVTPVASAWERIARLWPRTVGASVQYVGTWVDGGVVFVDGVVVVSTREHAELLARKHAQRAYFDIDAGESVYLDESRASVEDIYTALCAAAGYEITPENAHTLPPVSVTLPAHVSLDAVIERLFGDDAWVDSEPVGEDAFGYYTYAIYNDELLPDDQSGCYTFDDNTDTLTVWGFYKID